nr:calcium-translocating P-type ATPase, PMCA-type [bacterium]
MKTPQRPDQAMISAGGLTSEQVSQSREQFGENALPPSQRQGFFRQLLESFGDPIIKILLAALAINIIFLFRKFDWFESAGIAIAIFLATFVSTLSEYGSESAFLRLQQDAAGITCRVRRAGGVAEVPIGDIVVGDHVLLQAGERIPADGVLVAGSVQVDQSSINGESREASKRPSALPSRKWDFSAADQVFRGTVVSAGDGEMVAVNIGDGTVYGKMAREVQEKTRESPLKLRLGALAGSISKMGYWAAALVLLADLFQSIVLANGMQGAAILAHVGDWHLLLESLMHAVTLAITVVVVAVPEGLPMMITVVLSSNMLRMLKDHVLVRKLVGIETSGSLNILFTDKTGTLTRGQLKVVQFIDGAGRMYTKEELQANPALYRRVEQSCLYNTGSLLSKGRVLGGNATDRALLEYILPLKETRPSVSIKSHVPFDSAKKFSAVHLAGEEDICLVKGAPEKILPACRHYVDAHGRIVPMGSLATVQARMRQMADRAVRVLAIAISGREVTPDGAFSDLTLVGLVGIRDEVRPEAVTAVAQVQRAGVQVVMITGDNRQTAVAVAREVGLLAPGAEGEAVITSEELARLSDRELSARLKHLRVVARALPGDKSRLVRLAQEAQLVVGMTGDGINDAPALKRADVGFAMGSGTEVAKEAGDIVILDDNFASIAKAILYGRTLFKSIRKFIVFQLTMNLSAVGISVIGPFIGIDSPVTVVQMLWINIIMDTLAGMAFAGEAPLPEYMDEPPKKRDEPVLNRYMLNQILCMGLFTIVLCTLFLKLDIVKEWFGYSQNPIWFLTAFFCLFIFCGVFNSFNARTPRVNLLAHLFRNPLFMVVMAAVIGVQILLVYFGGTLFRTAALPFDQLRTVLLIALTVIPADLMRKGILRLAHRKGSL